MQKSRTSDLIFGVDALVHELSSITPLLPGDLVFTGTPSGVGGTRNPPRFLAPGDELVSTIERRRNHPHPLRREGAVMHADLELAYLGVEVADVAAFGTFLRDVVGLVAGEPTATGDATWRNDDRAQRIVVSEGPRNDAVFVGFEATSREAFAHAVERARAAGVKVTDGTAAVKSARRVEDLVHLDTPWGVPVEIVRGLATAGEPFESPLVPGGFLTKGQGFGHVVFVTSDLDEADRFARDVIGLVQSDWLTTDLGGIPLTVRFYHCNQRHHSLAIGSVPIELPQTPAPRDARDGVTGQRRLRVRPRLERRPPDRQRAREARQRQDVQLLRRHTRRLSARVRLRGPHDRRAVD